MDDAARIAELEAEANVLRMERDEARRDRDHLQQRALMWKGRYEEAAAEAERLSRRPDLAPEQCVAIARAFDGEPLPWRDPERAALLDALRGAVERAPAPA